MNYNLNWLEENLQDMHQLCREIPMPISAAAILIAIQAVQAERKEIQAQARMNNGDAGILKED